MTLLNRRDVLAGLSALTVAALASPSILRAAAPLTLYGPPAAPSAVLAHAVKGGFLRDVAPSAVFRAWKTPDEMRAAVASGSMGAVVMPSYAAANLHNRGLGLGLLNVLTTGLLYVVSKDESLKTVADLKGRTLALPFKNDMPDFVMARLLTKAGLGQGDVTLEYTASPPEAVQLLLTGRADAALLSEPAATGVIIKAKSMFMAVHRAIDIQAEWQAVAGTSEIPQAGLALTAEVQQALGAAGTDGLQKAIEAALADALGDPGAASAAVADALGFPPEIIAASFPTSHLSAIPASAARKTLEGFYGVLAEANPAIIGGKLPGDGFYLV
ncbi:ABC transporter substrate-binding protein [Shinella zoogloeoides]|uniref:ABC transporter substrate-binding protein n=1 Tax=Shinella zoogloeoides TaxID=352475 RepID=UPI00273EE6D8|nr:PhnD/SsuA/transferrin family substrate-binding protein [Shinella zoogloeoides]WLR95656.1 PhnD/SsuA/transferrin family substrate-binding protein [Shinella zoogloeoides]